MLLSLSLRPDLRRSSRKICAVYYVFLRFPDYRASGFRDVFPLKIVKVTIKVRFVKVRREQYYTKLQYYHPMWYTSVVRAVPYLQFKT